MVQLTVTLPPAVSPCSPQVTQPDPLPRPAAGAVPRRAGGGRRPPRGRSPQRRPGLGQRRLPPSAAAATGKTLTAVIIMQCAFFNNLHIA